MKNNEPVIQIHPDLEEIMLVQLGFTIGSYIEVEALECDGKVESIVLCVNDEGRFYYQVGLWTPLGKVTITVRPKK